MNIMNHFTLRTLKQNKVRTLITIIGIILSTAMFTAVTTMVISLQHYLVEHEINRSGAWEGMINGITSGQKDEFISDNRLKEYTVIKNVGYAELKDCYNEDKPYVFVESIDDKYKDLISIEMVKGRMPKNDSELLISEHMSENGGIDYEIGDKVTLDIGYRTTDGKNKLEQNIQYQEDEVSEKLEWKEKQSYTIVGICKRPTVEGYTAPGYTAFTCGKDTSFDSYSVYYSAKNAKKSENIVNAFEAKLDKEDVSNIYSVSTDIHSELLRFMGKSNNDIFNKVLYSMAAILIVIIMIASISLIYNAFSISISERTKQYGMLKSIGATKKQMRKAVIFEAFSLCIIGVPIGILSGLLGIGITLHFVGRLMIKTMLNDNGVAMKMCVSWQALLVAAIIAVVTVVISALIPASRAIRMTAIQAIRETNDTKIGRRSIRTPKFIYKIFGFEGMLGSKNFKRNRKKQRITVFSLAISVVLFVSANSFSAYMVKSINLFDENETCDISCTVMPKELKNNTIDSTLKGIEALSAVDRAAYSKMQEVFAMIPFDKVDKDYIEVIRENMPDMVDEKNKRIAVNCCVYYINDDYYKDYLEENKLDVSKYMDKDKKLPLIWDACKITTADGILSVNVLKDADVFDKVYFNMEDKYLDKKINGYEIRDVNLSEGEVVNCYKKSEGDSDSVDSDKPKAYPMDEIFVKQSFGKGDKTNIKLPLGVRDNSWYQGVTVVFPYSAYAGLPKETKESYSIFYDVNSENHKTAKKQIEEYLKGSSFAPEASSNIDDRRAYVEANEAMVVITNIFSYGFIILISLIVIANVFNTISTNIQLRRKEFAMLKSVGMTGKGFDKMMNYECMLYGIKGLLYGMPVALLMTYFIYKAVGSGWNVPFFVPATSIVVIVISVFVVVFASMIYSMKKIKKDNPIEALRNDNV